MRHLHPRTELADAVTVSDKMKAARAQDTVGNEIGSHVGCRAHVGSLPLSSPWCRARGTLRSRSGSLLRKALVVLCAATTSLPGICFARVLGVKDPPSAFEMAQLPQYCQWQFNRDKPQFQAPQFQINRVFPNCGVGTNHFCPGIVAINRANQPGADPDHRRYWTERASGEFEYTARAIKSYPDCRLHEPLSRYKKQVESMLRTMR